MINVMRMLPVSELHLSLAYTPGNPYHSDVTWFPPTSAFETKPHSHRKPEFFSVVITAPRDDCLCETCTSGGERLTYAWVVITRSDDDYTPDLKPVFTNSGFLAERGLTGPKKLPRCRIR